LNFSLVLPDKALYDKADVDLVVVPGSAGNFGIMKDHVPTIAQLDAGVITVHGAEGEGETSYFISGGFAIVNESGANVCAVEAVEIKDLDASLVSAGLTEAQAKLAAAADDRARAEAQISVGTYMAMQAAVSGN